ncbi:roundabout homolog 3-like [Portunus trituberculatus]|uniref:roundabout homolog 3-like n=1 Tax=Portunus trituberculatus TaxID=210409 RepID=UPI001E1D0769|nr:roundabout homolog 3-like [Portunus trituberculatus]
MRLAAPLLLRLLPTMLLVGWAAGEDGKQRKGAQLDQFMEEVRGALASQWDLLQNLRYHTLSIKVRLVKLEAQMQSLADRLESRGDSQDADTRISREKASCDDNMNRTLGADEADFDEEREVTGMDNLLEAMRNLTQVYSILADSSSLCGGTNPGKAPSGPDKTTTTTTTTTPPTDRKECAENDEEKEEEGDTEFRHSTNVTARLGSKAILRCRLDHLQDPEQAVWIRVRDQNWLSQGRHKVVANENRIAVDFANEELKYYRLFLKDVRREDEGAYECNLSTTPAVRQTIWLTVLDPAPSPPCFKHFPRDRLAVEGQDVTFICRVSGYPRPSITWTRNSLQVSSSARHQITPAGDLIIRGVRRGDAGRYVCEGVNSKGQVDSEALLTVRQPTKILRTPRDKELLVGEDTMFRCRAKGDEGTPLLVEWLKDGVTLNVSTDVTSRRFISSNNALVITLAVVEDSGEYTCRASTPFDVASASATLTVREEGDTTSVTTTTTTATTTTTLPLLLDYCPPPFERIQKYVCVLEITHMKLNWDEAAEHCRREGGQLAWEGEGKRVLQDFLEARYGLSWRSTSSNTRWPFWVGGRESNGGQWQWLDGSPVSPGIWAPQHRRPSERRAAKEDWCLMFDGYQGYLGTALPCHSKRYFLCRLK